VSKASVDLILRIGIFGTFVGHGILALQVNPPWTHYLVTVGFKAAQAEVIMPMIGALDVVLATWVLFKPNKYVLLWMVFWAFVTALIRPLSGGSILGFIERAANWAAPLALFYLRRLQK
jgi:hypothetical protein